MLHSSLAGGLCTFSLFILVLEVIYFQEDSKIHPYFFYFYGAGVGAWAMLGIVSQNTGLLMISFIQLTAVIFTYSIAKKKGRV